MVGCGGCGHGSCLVQRPSVNNAAGVAEVPEVTSPINIFLSSMMAKNLKRKRDRDTAMEEEEVCVRHISYH